MGASKPLYPFFRVVNDLGDEAYFSVDARTNKVVLITIKKYYGGCDAEEYEIPLDIIIKLGCEVCGGDRV